MTIIVERKPDPAADLAGLRREVAVLDWEERRKSRQRLTTRSGLEIALALPTGSILEDGEIVYRDGERYVAIEAASEDVLCIYPESRQQSALAAYEIGNRHMPISISRGVLSTMLDPLLESHFKKNGIRCERRRVPFEPIRKNHSHG